MTSVQALHAPNLPIIEGTRLKIYARPYLCDRIDPDRVITLRSLDGAKSYVFLIRGDDGQPRKPTWDDLEIIHAEGGLDILDEDPESAVRRRARALNYDRQQILGHDIVSEFRAEMVRFYYEHPCSKSERKLGRLIAQALQDPAIASLDGAWTISPSTLKLWLRERGGPGSVKLIDGMSMTGRYVRKLKVAHPKEIAVYHLIRATKSEVVANQHHLYVKELAHINHGRTVDRLTIDINAFELTDQPAAYVRPKTPYTPMPYKTFWRWVVKLRGKVAYQERTTAAATYQAFGGGGFPKPMPAFGYRAYYDDTPLPKEIFAVTMGGTVPLGTITLGIMSEALSDVVAGWCLYPGPPNSTVICRTLLSANASKTFPADLLALQPELSSLRFKPSEVFCDNATMHHGITVKQTFKELGIATVFAGAGMPRDKSLIEKLLGILQQLLVAEMPDKAIDPTEARQRGEPDAKVHCTFEDIERLLPRAVATLNLLKTRRHDKKSRMLVFKEKRGGRALPVIVNVAEFEMTMGTVETEITMNNTGITMHNRRYAPRVGEGQRDMSSILEDFYRGHQSDYGNQNPAQKARDRKKKPTSYKVMVKYQEDDLGFACVWNPYRQGGPAWEIFDCTDSSMQGVPKWLHYASLEKAAIASAHEMTEEEEAIMRAHLLEDLASLDPGADARDRAFLAKAVANPVTRQFISQLTEVCDEDELATSQEEQFVQTTTATGRRVQTNIPRSRPPRNLDRDDKRFPKKPAVKRGSARKNSAGARPSDPVNAVPQQGTLRQPTTKPARRTQGSGRPNLKWSDLA